jgi:hypothetical protein
MKITFEKVITCYDDVPDKYAELYLDGDSQWVARLFELNLVGADELQQIADKLRELNGGATDGQEPCES